MYQHGAGELQDGGKEIISRGYAFQCHKCRVAFVTEYHPSSGKLGIYGKDNPGYLLGTSYTMRNPDYVGENKSLSVEPWRSSYIWY
ncbi:hypothetical protein KO561_18375 [Radiobacillus kanasensis]|uniref:hypothetical protein n=1 Tax=Radiobacillus kanasensis TaxID=2844358 RepID=UPI001E349A3C|nr:hypothetical protein [Radiobacillus kanasensis]UFT99121.1 hypothetical protein KO561_18375 [Radiobacillus kanasensis]